MISLIPDWAHHYGEFWRAIRIRNLWFIRLRYFAVVMLVAFVVLGELLANFQLTSSQIIATLAISFVILVYNVTIHYTRRFIGCEAGSFNCLHLSIIQMGLDLIALMYVVYYTGLIESPLHLFFIFHMIIGSLILPGKIVYLAAGLVSASFGLLAMFQRYDMVGRHFIHGLYTNVRPQTLIYDILFIIVFSFMLFVSVYIANKISKQLYKREQQLRTTLEKLNESEIAKQKYLIGVVHEIKTPVAATYSILDLVIQKYVGPVDSEVERKLFRAKQRTEETISLLNDLLRISKLKILDVRTTEDIDAKNLMESLIDKQLETIKSKSITLNLIDKREVNKKIKSDSVLLELALSNLLSNAVKYVNQNGIIEIVIYESENRFMIAFSDNGIGIPKESQPRIFNQFYRATNVDKSKHEGTGMGLAIVKEIIEMFGGTISVISPSRIGTENNPGTTFEINLPYHFKPNEYDIFEVNNQEYLRDKNNF